MSCFFKLFFAHSVFCEEVKDLKKKRKEEIHEEKKLLATHNLRTFVVSVDNFLVTDNISMDER